MRLPEGWKELTLADVCKKSISYGIVQTGDSVQGGILCVRVVDLTKKEISSNEMITTTEEISQSYKKTILEKNEIMFALRGEVGLSRMVDDSLVGANLTRGIARLSPKASIVDPFYLLWAVRSPKFRADLIRRIGGSALQEIGIGELRRVITYIPPLPEQQKIAKILSTWDKAIENLEALIAAKKKRKKAMMQRLLTGKMRFPGFGGKWKDSFLTKHCHVGTGGKDLQNAEEGGRYPFFVRSQNIERINSYSYDGEAILIPGDGRVGEIYHYINGKFDYHQRVYKISDFKGVFGKFIYYYLMEFFRKEVKRHSAKATVDSLRMPIFREMRLSVPSLDEQQKIASVLSAADKEITIHQNQLAALKQQKKGLMQQLLTGKKRAKVNQVAA